MRLWPWTPLIFSARSCWLMRSSPTKFTATKTKRMALLPVDTDTIQWLFAPFPHAVGFPRMCSFSVRAPTQLGPPYAVEVELANPICVRAPAKLLTCSMEPLSTKGGRWRSRTTEPLPTKHFSRSPTFPPSSLFPTASGFIGSSSITSRPKYISIFAQWSTGKLLHKIDLQRRAANSQTENINEAGAQIPMDLWGQPRGN